MKIIYIAPAFHPNQHPIVKGWVEEGHQVDFICQYKINIESHAYCTPYVLGYAGLFRFCNVIYKRLYNVGRQQSAYPEAFQDKCGFPPIGNLSRFLKKRKPDIVILRERSVYSIVSYLVCRMQKIPCILYNQTPLWDNEPPRNDLAHRLVKALTPNVRMTPVYGDPVTGYLDKHAVYIPFVIDPQRSPDERQPFPSGQIRLLCVGKFEKRKHQLMLLMLLARLLPEYPLHLTLVGEATTAYHKQYLKKVQNFIKEHHLEEQVSIHVNRKPEEMAAFYRDADLFILPSTGEFASVSQLEAMSYSLPVIVSDTNGTSCYVEEGKNGYLFRDKDSEDLEKKLRLLLSDKDALLRMGECSYRLVMEKYSFLRYRKQIETLLARMSTSKKER